MGTMDKRNDWPEWHRLDASLADMGLTARERFYTAKEYVAEWNEYHKGTPSVSLAEWITVKILSITARA